MPSVMPTSLKRLLFLLALPSSALAAPVTPIDCVALMGVPEPGFYRDSCTFDFARPDHPSQVIVRASVQGQLVKRWSPSSYALSRQGGVTFSLTPLNHTLAGRRVKRDARVDLRIWLVFANGARREFVDDGATVVEYLPQGQR